MLEPTNQEFTQLVKYTRAKFDVSIEGAHDLIFADREMRRFVARRVNHDPECRKQALWDMRDKGEKSRFVMIDGKIRFRT